MKQIIALQEYTDKFISLYQGEIRNIEDNLADKLIEEGIVAEHSDESQGGGDNKNEDSVFVAVANLIERAESDDILIPDFQLNKTCSELNDAVKKDKVILFITKKDNLRQTGFIDNFEYDKDNNITGIDIDLHLYRCQIPELDGTKSKWVFVENTGGDVM